MPRLKGLPLSARFQPYLKNLNLQASRSCLPFVGREREIEAVIETLLRQWKNSPVLVGKPGVGKTALVNEVAGRIGRGEVPSFLKDKVILEFSLNAFIYSRTSPEALLKDIEELFIELMGNRQRIILFLDELQVSTIGSTVSSPTSPRLVHLIRNHVASHDLTIIATATPEEYSQSIKSDDLFSSYFEALFIPEPQRAEMRRILQGVKSHFERYYGLVIPPSILGRICPLAERFNPIRAFPDKAVQLLDVSCSKAAVKKRPQVTMDEVSESLASIAKLPVSIIRKNPRKHILGIQQYLESTLVNQREAVGELSRILKIFDLERNPADRKPRAILLFLGPAGIGKSLVAAKTAEYLFGSREKLRIVNLAALKKPNDYEKLIAGKEDQPEGLLVRELENHPFSIILFEQIGEAHENVLSFLSRTITRGELLDAHGHRHDLTNIIFILSLTSIGEERRESVIGFEKRNGQSTELVIPPKIMNVLDWMNEIIQFVPLSLPHLEEIARQEAQAAADELAKRHGCTLTIDPGVLASFARGAEKSGRFAHFVSEVVDRQVRMRALDLISGGNAKTSYIVKIKSGQVVFEPIPPAQPDKTRPPRKKARKKS